MKIIVQNIVTEYRDEGSGRVLVLLHGWMNTLQSFDAVVPYLKGYRLVRLDLPGFGKSEPPPRAWHVAEYVQFVRDFLIKLGVTEYVILGHSLGGRIILKGVSAGLLSPSKIVLIASAGNARRSTPRLRFYTMLAKTGKAFSFFLPRALIALLRDKLYQSAGSDDYRSAGALAGTYRNIVEEDLSADAARLSSPALLLWGSDDRTTPLEDGKRLAAAISGSELKVFPGAGHAPHRERPEEIARAIRSFV